MHQNQERLCLTIIYVLSIILAISMVSYHSINQKESPFVTAMSAYNLAFFPHVFNGAIIIAGFSTMTASLFAVTNLLVTLAKDGDARFGFFVSLLLVAIIGIVTLIMNRIWKKSKKKKGSATSLKGILE
jgi:L-asparagine transporter-like permease